MALLWHQITPATLHHILIVELYLNIRINKSVNWVCLECLPYINIYRNWQLLPIEVNIRLLLVVAMGQVERSNSHSSIMHEHDRSMRELLLEQYTMANRVEIFWKSTDFNIILNRFYYMQLQIKLCVFTD